MNEAECCAWPWKNGAECCVWPRMNEAECLPGIPSKRSEICGLGLIVNGTAYYLRVNSECTRKWCLTLEI